MIEIVKKFWLAWDKFISEMYLIQPGFTYCACGPFTKNKERIQKFKETGDSRYICRNELDKSLFSTWYGLWRFSRKGSFRLGFKRYVILLQILNMVDINEVLLL